MGEAIRIWVTWNKEAKNVPHSRQRVPANSGLRGDRRDPGARGARGSARPSPHRDARAAQAWVAGCGRERDLLIEPAVSGLKVQVAGEGTRASRGIG